MKNLAFELVSEIPEGTISADLGIPEERVSSLTDEANKLMTEAKTTSDALAKISQVVETPQELALMCYMFARSNY